MEFRTIFAGIGGGSASAGAIDLACRLAGRFGSHVEGFHMRLDLRTQVLAAAGLAPLASERIEHARLDAAAETAARARASFDAAVLRYGLPLIEEPPPPGGDAAPLARPSAKWREESGYGPATLAARARLFDLVLLGRSGRVVEEPHSNAIEEALLATGRPVLLAPAKPPTAIGERVALGWNDTPECARALAAALPFLRRARTVAVLRLGDGAPDAVARHLAWYGINATAHEVWPVKGVGAGELLLASAREEGADLLVMGGYGTAPWRERLFGGATSEVVGTSLLPVLLAH